MRVILPSVEFRLHSPANFAILRLQSNPKPQGLLAELADALDSKSCDNPHKTSGNQHLSQSAVTQGVPNPASIPPDLAEIITAWPTLPEALQTRILAIVRGVTALLIVLTCASPALALPRPSIWPDAIDGTVYVHIKEAEFAIPALLKMTPDGDAVYGQILPWQDTWVKFQGHTDDWVLDTRMELEGQWFDCGAFYFTGNEFIPTETPGVKCSAKLSLPVPEPGMILWVGMIVLWSGRRLRMRMATNPTTKRR